MISWFKSMFSIERWARFRPSGGMYLPEIDGLRFIAIMAVICVHINGIWTLNVGRKYPDMGAIENIFYRMTLLGGYGVELFFVISGFVLALPFLKYAYGEGKPVIISVYLKRRLTRLEPPYIISMLGYFALLPLFGKGSYESLLPHLTASLFYCHELIYNTGSVLNNNAWSLEIEVQFYLLVPLLLGLLGRIPKARQAILAGFVLVSSLHFLYLPTGFPRTLIQFFQYFSIGILICERWLSSWKIEHKKPLWDWVGGGAVLSFFALHLYGPTFAAQISNPWLFGLVACSALRGPVTSRIMGWSWIPVIGGMCYTIYLLHARIVSGILFGVFSRMQLTQNYIIDFIILGITVVIVTIAICSVFYALIERPCMDPDWPGKLSEKTRLLFSKNK